MLRTFWSTLLFATLVPGCAAANSDRRAYILAHPHGWMEVTIADGEIPAVPPGEDSDDPWERPYSCDIRVQLNDEPILRASAYPTGDGEPYFVNTGFRFPVPIGAIELELLYASCRVEDGEIVSKQFFEKLVVKEDQTHEIVFNGLNLRILEPRPDEVVSLEDIYEAITGTRSPVE
jgi:hypothetical protein